MNILSFFIIFILGLICVFAFICLFAFLLVVMDDHFSQEDKEEKEEDGKITK